MIKTLTERRKADRIEMARQVRALCAELNVPVTDGEYPGPREIKLDIRHPGGACLSLDFDGDSCQPDIHVMSWYIDSDSPACFSNSFGDINRYHYRKATFVARGFTDLMVRLGWNLEALNAGDGYSKERAETVGAESVAQFRHIKEYVKSAIPS
jgi:hypothetical protein